MKIIQKAKPSFAINTAASSAQKMSLKMSGKAFAVLSSSLYENKIRAIIRELSTNAWDAHVDAGTMDVPFEVKLPTVFDPVFHIRDFGTGICEEDIYRVYNALFESTKTDSNEAVGMLGLGSKTPFSYTDQITVTSFQNGVKKVYISILGDDGIPSISKITNEETTEGDGLRVQFPVLSGDVSRFKTEATEVYLTFTKGVKPNVNTKLDDLEEICDDFYLYEGRFNDNYRTFNIIQGNVAYPVDLRKVGAGGILNLANIRKHMFLEVPIGTVDFTPSRENITDSKENYARLEPALKKLNANLVKSLEGDYVNVNTELEAYLALDSGRNNKQVFSRDIFEAIMAKKGIALSKYLTWESPDVDQLLKDLEADTAFISGGRSISLGFMHNKDLLDSNDDVIGSTRHIKFYNPPFCVEMTDIVVVDDPSRFRSKLKSAYKGTRRRGYIVVRNATRVAELEKMLKGCKTVYTSDLPDVVKKAAGQNAGVRFRWFWKLGTYAHNGSRKTLAAISVDQAKEFYYIRKDKLTQSDIDNMQKFKILPDDCQVVQVGNRYVEKMEKWFGDTAVDLEKFLNAYLVKNKDRLVKERISSSESRPWGFTVMESDLKWIYDCDEHEYHLKKEFQLTCKPSDDTEYVEVWKGLWRSFRIEGENDGDSSCEIFINRLAKEFPLAYNVLGRSRWDRPCDLTKTQIRKVLRKDD